MGDEGGGMQQGNVGGQMYPGGYQVPHGQGHQQQGGGLMDQLQEFWVRQRQEVGKVSEFKLQSLPLARIKKIMKSDEDVKMISAEAPVLFAKACEMFIQELTIRSWAQTEEAKRRTLQRSDVSGAIQKTDIFDFLIDIVPRNEPKEDEAHRSMPNVSNVNEGGNLSFYPMGNQGVPGVPYVMPQPMMHGNPGVQGVPSGSQVQNQDPSGQMFQQGMPAGYNPAMYPQQPMMGMNQQQMPYMGMQQRQQHMFMQQGQPRYGNYQQNNQDQNQQSLHQ